MESGAMTAVLRCQRPDGEFQDRPGGSTSLPPIVGSLNVRLVLESSLAPMAARCAGFYAPNVRRSSIA